MAAVAEIAESYEVKGAAFRMAEVPAGTFAMGTQPDGRLLAGGKGIRQAVLDGYALSARPVSQALWEAVTGSNPSSARGETLPVDRVSRKDCRKFLRKLTELTGVPFHLPTEAQWELALKKGIITQETGLREWCADNYTEELPKRIGINPLHRDGTDCYTVRTARERRGVKDYTRAGRLTFRLAVNLDRPVSREIMALFVDENPEREHSCRDEAVFVQGFKFDMTGVRGGVFQMGATPEQGKYAEKDEKPAHEVTVADFEIGKYEVTVGLWRQVMGGLPYGNDPEKPNLPVVNVSWYLAQEFLMQLNLLTGRKFRLPTEAEWEYAARGGTAAGGYRYAGSPFLDEVGAYAANAASRVQPVGRYRRNELHLYDMSGNVWEWCQDRYAEYGKAPADSVLHVIRGGSAASPGEACRVSNRSGIPANNVKRTFGLRLAL